MSEAKNFFSIPPQSMDVNSLISWFGKQFATSAELFMEAEQYYSDLKKHHQNLSELMGMLQDLKKQPKSRREEIEEVIETASEVIDAIQSLTSNRFATDEQPESLENLEKVLSGSDEGKLVDTELQKEIDQFLVRYTSYKAKLGLETQKDVSALTGIDRRYISIIEAGKHKPQFKTLKRLADAFGIEVENLIS